MQSDTANTHGHTGDLNMADVAGAALDDAHRRFFPSPPATASPSGSSSGSRELQVVWQGRWNADDMEIDSAASGSAPTARSREYKLLVSSWDDLVSKIHTHFPTRLSQPIQITDEDQRPLNASAFRQLKDRDVVLVFEAAPGEETSIVFQWSKSFMHIPHPSIVTYSQELLAVSEHQPAIAYALAEFVDNSISALRKYRTVYRQPNHDGQIRIIFMEQKTGTNRWSIVIEDDGCGMTKETLEAFSRMGDAPQYRGEAREAVEPDADNNYLNINISQWGIGAKSAGFFIGNNIIVSSRSPALKQVLECSMSQKRMFKAHQETGNAFNDELSRRAIGDEAAYPMTDMHPYMAQLIRDEATRDHFTRICVTGIEDRHLARLAHIDKIAEELADIYNRFLHGPLGRETPTASNAGKTWLQPNIIVERVTDIDTPVDGIAYKVLERINLHDVIDNSASQFQLLKRGPVFRFEMIVNAPMADTHSTEMIARSSQAKVRGEIYYLPRSVDGETHPDLRRRRDARLAQGMDDEDGNPISFYRRAQRTPGAAARSQLGPTAAAAAAHALSTGGMAAPAAARDRLDADGNIIQDDEASNTFDVYWHGRLIPLSHVDKLSFMKFTPENKDCLPRMKGFLFFSFPFLTSRNKLTFAERNLQEYLNSPSNHPNDFTHASAGGSSKDSHVRLLDDHGNELQRLTTSSRVANRWSETLKTWKALDANYTWSERHFLKEESARQGTRLYSQVSIHGAALADFQVLKAGKIYKLKHASKKPDWIEARYFEQESIGGQVIDSSVVSSEFGGSGKVWGQLMPKEALQGEVAKSLRLIDKDTPLARQQQEYESHRTLIMAGEPHHIAVWMEPRVQLKNGTVFRKTAGYEFPGTAIAIYGHPCNGTHRILVKSEKVACEIRRFTKDFPPEDGSDRRTTAAHTQRAQTSKSRSEAANRPHKRQRQAPREVDSDDEPLVARLSVDGVDGAGVGVVADVDDDLHDGESIPFRDTAACMSREVALAVSEGQKLDLAAQSSDATAVAASANAKKRKTPGAAEDLGRRGFTEYQFSSHTALGRYVITFDLPDWKVNGAHVSRSSVPAVRCEVILTPGLPTKVALNRVDGAEPTINMQLGVEDASLRVGLHMTDQYKNEWNYANLRGEMDVCGIRVASISTSVPELAARCNPILQWSKEYKHWSVTDLVIDMPPLGEEQDSALPLNLASDRMDVDVTLHFESNSTPLSDGMPVYVFDPPPKPDALARLHAQAVKFRVRVGPGQASDFICHLIPDELTINNGSAITGLSMHLADAWHHPTVGKLDMQLSAAAQIPFLPSNLFTADHDVLTRRGWKLIHQVQVGDEVWSMANPDTGDTRQDWSIVTETRQQPAPANMQEFQSKYFFMLTTEPITIEGITSTPVPKEAHHTVYGLISANANYFIRRHSNKHHWSPIFTGSSPVTVVSFPLPSLASPLPLVVDSLGRVLFDDILVSLPPDVFASHCVEEIEGEFTIRFFINIHLNFKGLEDIHPVRSIEVTIKPRWGPIALRLFNDSEHLKFVGKKLPVAPSTPFLLDGRAHDDIANLYLGFVHESGCLIPISELQSGVGPRQRELQFWVDGLDGANSHFTLADISPTGRIESGLNFPTIIGTNKPTHETTKTNATTTIEDGAPKLFQGQVRMAVVEETPPKGSDDTAMTDGGSSDTKPPLSSWLPAPSLLTPFSIRVSPGVACRWSVSTSFPRGFKCGLIWGEHVQIGLVDQFGNRTIIPTNEHINLEMSIYAAPPNTMVTPMAIASDDVLMTDSTAGIDQPTSTAPIESSTSSAAPMEIDATVGAAIPTSQPAASPPSDSVAAQTPSVASGADANTNTNTNLPLANVLKNFHPSRPSLPDGRIAPFYVSPSAFVVLKAGSYWLVIRDQSGLFGASHPFQVTIIPGSPHRIKAFTSKECTPDTEVGYDASNPDDAPNARSIQTSAKGKIGRLWCKFFDRGGNETVSSQTVQLQLVLPKDAAATRTTQNTNENDTTTEIAQPTTKVEEDTAIETPCENQVDKTISGIYAYPLLATKPSHQSIFAPESAASSTPALKDEFHPLSTLTGSQKHKDPHAASFVLLEEFTLHLNSAHLVGSSLLIQAREPKAATNANGTKKKPMRAVKNDIIIPLDVKPFLQAVEAIMVESVYPHHSIQADSNRTIKPALMELPTGSIELSRSGARTKAKANKSVLSGTTLPIIRVKPLSGGAAMAVSGATDRATIPPAASTVSDVSPRVKSEPGSSLSSDDESVFTASWLVRGLSLEVYHLPNGDPARRRAIKNLYQPPRFEPATKEFRFEPMNPDPTNEEQSARDDYVFNAIGEWVFLVRFLEPRELIADILLPSECERFGQLTQTVLPGPPDVLIFDPRPAADLVVGNIGHDLSSTLPSFKPRAGRNIATNLTIKINDQFGQQVKFDHLTDEMILMLQSMKWSVAGVAERALEIAPQPKPLNTTVSNSGREAIIIIDSDEEEEQLPPAPTIIPAAPAPSQPPQLSVSTPLLHRDSSTLVFPDVSIVSNSTGDSGKYGLEFRMPFPFSKFGVELNFYFSNDQDQLDQHREVQRQRRALVQAVQVRHEAKLREVVAIQQEQQKLDSEHAAIDSTMKSIQDELSRVTRQLVSVGVSVPAHVSSVAGTFRSYLSDQRVTLREQQSVEKAHTIPAKIESLPRDVQPPPRLTRADGYHGRVAQLATIADSKVCALVSWHCAHFLNTFVTSDRNCLADRELRRWGLANRHGQFLDLANLNRKNFDPSIMPHHRIHNARAAAYVPRGRPRYLVSCLDFPDAPSAHDRNEYMQLFMSLCGGTLILDSMDDAVAYRHHLVQHRQFCPTILVLKECKALNANNIERFDMNAFARGLHALTAHFEIRPAGSGTSASIIRDREQQLAAIEAALKQLPPIEERQRAVHGAMKRLDHVRESQSIGARLAERQKELAAIRSEVRSVGGSVDLNDAPSSQRVLPSSSSSSSVGVGVGAASSSAVDRSAATLAQQNQINEQERRRARAAEVLLEKQRILEHQRAQAARDNTDTARPQHR